MIPLEVVQIARLISPHFDDLSDDESSEVIRAAFRIWNAGYRAPEDHR